MGNSEQCVVRWKSACSALLLSYDAGPASGLQTGGQEKDQTSVGSSPEVCSVKTKVTPDEESASRRLQDNDKS